MDHFQLRDGVVHCEEVPLAEIAAGVGTPVYVYSTATMVRHARVLAEALEPLPDPLIAYAVKANPNAAVLATLARRGLGADIVSAGEYRRARTAGVPPDKIVFSGVGKTEEEMALALREGLYQFNLESLPEAESLSQVAVSLGREAPVGFRVNPDVVAGSHAKISTGAAENKFGIAVDDALAAYAAASRLPGLRVQGIAVHIGSQLMSLAPLEEAFGRVGQLIEQLRGAGCAIAVADLGGAGADLGVGTGGDVGIDPEADRRLEPERDRDLGERLGLRERFQVELVEPFLERRRHLLLGLADPGEDDPLRGDAGGAGAAILAARDDVGTEPLACERRQHRGIGIGLDRIGDQRIGQRLERAAQHLGVPDHGRGRIDIDRGADLCRDLRQRHVLAMDDAFPQLEMVHLAPNAPEREPAKTASLWHPCDRNASCEKPVPTFSRIAAGFPFPRRALGARRFPR